MPRRIILLRHGEKANAYALCSVGQQRAIALRDAYLGRNASNVPYSRGKPRSLFGHHAAHPRNNGSIGHELGLPVHSYAVVPTGKGKTQLLAELTRARKQQPPTCSKTQPGMAAPW